jgi:hypothetical protein
VSVASECAHCNKTMRMEIDSDMNCSCQEADCTPVIFVPEVNLKTLKDPNIIDAF